MSLLPKTYQDFTQTEYWNSFFQKRGKKSFEWYETKDVNFGYFST